MLVCLSCFCHCHCPTACTWHLAPGRPPGRHGWLRGIVTITRTRHGLGGRFNVMTCCASERAEAGAGSDATDLWPRDDHPGTGVEPYRAIAPWGLGTAVRARCDPGLAGSLESRPRARVRQPSPTLAHSPIRPSTHTPGPGRGHDTARAHAQAGHRSVMARRFARSSGRLGVESSGHPVAQLRASRQVLGPASQ